MVLISKTVVAGGEFKLKIEADFADLSPADTDFIFQLVLRIDEFEAKRKKGGENGATPATCSE